MVALLDARGNDVYVRTPPEPTRLIAGGDWIAAAG